LVVEKGIVHDFAALSNEETETSRQKGRWHEHHRTTHHRLE